MRLPRDLTGSALAGRLGQLGYKVTRQTGSHIRLTTGLNGEHHVTIPAHDPGTLSAILAAVAQHAGMTKDALAEQLFGK